MTRGPSIERRRRIRRMGAPRVEALEGRALLATLTVTTTADSGAGSLRAAIEAANADPGADTIDFDPSVAGTISLSSPLPDLTTAIDLHGPGAATLTVARSGATGTPEFRIFTVSAGAEVSLSGLTVSGGRADSGGAISNAGTLIVSASTISSNNATHDGAGIFNAGMLAVTASTIGSNSAEFYGGGISNYGTLTVSASTIRGNNTPSGDGGGIANYGTLAVTTSTVSANRAASGGGGGIFNYGTLSMSSSTVSDNIVTLGDGGGILNLGTLTVSTSTISGNSAPYGGGGISNSFSGTVTVTASTISSNSAASGAGVWNSASLVIAASTVVANASGSGPSGIDGPVTLSSSLLSNPGGNITGPLTSLGHNLFSDDPDPGLAPTDLIDAAPLLGPLADNGGPTLTHALLPGSPAIDAGAAVEGLATDQRGVPRPQGLAPDIGAFELDHTDRPFVLLAPAPGPGLVGTSQEATATVYGTDLHPLAGVAVTFVVTAGPNAGAIGTTDPDEGLTDAQGRVRFRYVGSGGPGSDVLVATADVPGSGPVDSPPAKLEWTTLTVTTTADDGPGSLRSAIALANRLPGRDTIDFGPGMAGIVTLLKPLPDLSTDIDIRGPGAATLTVARSGASGTPEFRIFTVSAGAEVSLSGLTVSGGSADSGGGVANSGSLVVASSRITHNSAHGSGGGIFNSGSLTISATTISDDSVAEDGSGGGLYNAPGAALTLASSTVSHNSAPYRSNYIDYVTAGSGGGIWNGGELTISSSTISGNGALSGGGISNSGTLTINASTLSGNSSGGVSVLVAYPTAPRYRIEHHQGVGANIAGPATLQSTILDAGDMAGLLTSLGHNLFSFNPGAGVDPTDLISTGALLGPLSDNGGPTLTHALLPGSPAIDAGAAIDGLATDQRGVARPQGSAPDIGAFESRGFALEVVSGDGQAATVGTAFAAPLVVRVSSPFGEPVAGGRVSFTAPAAGASAALGDATIGADGTARLTASAGAEPGTYRVTIHSAGAPDTSLTLTNLNGPVTPTVVPTGPLVTGWRRLGYHARPTRLILALSAPLDPASAANASAYRLVAPGADGRLGTRDDRRIKIRSASYDQAADTVTLRPARLLSVRRRYLLTVDGTTSAALRGVNGSALDGNGDGQPGGDYRAVIRGFGPGQLRKRARPAHAAGRGPRPLASGAASGHRGGA